MELTTQADHAEALQLFHRPGQLLGLPPEVPRSRLDLLLERPVGLLEATLVLATILEQTEGPSHRIEVTGEVTDLVLVCDVDGRVEVPHRRSAPPTPAARPGNCATYPLRADGHGGCGAGPPMSSTARDRIPVTLDRMARAGRHVQRPAALFRSSSLVDDVGGLHEEGRRAREGGKFLSKEIGATSQRERLALREDLDEHERLLKQQRFIEARRSSRCRGSREAGDRLACASRAASSSTSRRFELDLLGLDHDDDGRETHEQ